MDSIRPHLYADFFARPGAMPIEMAIAAYSSGSFPMSSPTFPDDTLWLHCEPRSVIPIDRFRIPRTLRKVLRHTSFDVRVDSAFDRVVLACSESGSRRNETWINRSIIDTAISLNRAGFGHSVECWRGNELVGGLYGFAIGTVFLGESMFCEEDYASQIALVHLVARLKAANFTLLDSQMHTAHMARFGLVHLSHVDYRAILDKAVTGSADFLAVGTAEIAASLSRITGGHAGMENKQ